MRVSVTVEQAPDHPLILRAVPLCFALEKVNASFGESNGDLHGVFPERELLRSRKKVTNHLQST